MSISRSEYLNQTLRTLVAFFGFDAVKRTLTSIEAKNDTKQRSARPPKTIVAVRLPKLIADLEASDLPRFELLKPFFSRLQKVELLPQAEDVRRFAALAGAKSLVGKSRKDLLPKLAPLLAPVPINELRLLLERAEGISEEERRQGFSVITEHLLREPGASRAEHDDRG
jgi:hypothetical protein